MGRSIQRPEDMSPDGYLMLYLQADGDIIVVIRPEGGFSAEHSVEFCNSGGRSPRTLKALRALFEAMEEDGLAGEWGEA